MIRFHGIFSLLLILLSIAIGVFAISSTSLFHAIIYIVITIAGFGCVLHFYCLKCPCRLDSCGHVFPGKLTKLFPGRESHKYSVLDLVATISALTLIIFFPQYWLWKQKLLFFGFWLIIGVGTVEILLFVCKDCKNEKCPVYQSLNQ